MKLSQDDVEKIVVRVVDYGLSTGFVARQFGVTRRRVQQLMKHYRETGEVPVLKKKPQPCDKRKPSPQGTNRWHTILSLEASSGAGMLYFIIQQIGDS